jgi:RNA polymerase subunit RPABC4/transcription elongation factor Spt4
MAETLVEKKVCRECGAEVRPQTSFCYNCGKSVTETPDRDPADEASSVWFGETIISDGPEPSVSEEPEYAVTEVVEEPLPAEPAVDPAEYETEKIERESLEPENLEAETAPGREDPADLDPVHHSLPVESGMRSAASIRRKPKTFQRREVEIVWEEYEGKSNLKYILITLLVVLFTVIVFWIAMTMK